MDVVKFACEMEMNVCGGAFFAKRKKERENVWNKYGGIFSAAI